MSSYWKVLTGGMLIIVTLATPSMTMADDLDDQVQSMLKARCVNCHDELGAAAGGGVDNLLKLDELSDGYLDPSNPKASYLFTLVLGETATMPKQRYRTSQSNGPLTDTERKTLEDWIQRGGASEAFRKAQQGTERSQISEDRVVELIAADLATLSGAELRNARYLTLSNLHNHVKVTDERLEVFRAAVVKTLNSLSRNSDVLGLDTSDAVNKLIAVDKDRTVFRFDLRHIRWTEDEWDRICRHYPYGMIYRNGAGKSIATMTSSELPWLRADWFVFATLQPPLYHDLLGIPTSLQELLKQLGIDRFQAIRDGLVARAGMEFSKVSVNNRLLERIALTLWGGAFHISDDFGSNDGEQNFFENPLGPSGVFDTDHAYRQDGGEVIFNLPNGFQAYALVTATGDRLDTAPQTIVSDSSMPGGVIINGISCLSCHVQGMKPELGDQRLATLDQVRESCLANKRDFNAAEREMVEGLYPPHDEFLRLIEGDRQRFLDAMTRAGIPQKGGDEPARALFDQFVSDLTLETVAGEFAVSPEAMEKLLNQEHETRQVLFRLKRGTLKRQLYLATFQKIVQLIGDHDPRPFEKLPSPYFGEKVEQTAIPNQPATETVDAYQSSGPIIQGQTGVDLIDAEHRTGALQIEIRTADERKSYRDGEAITCYVRATEDCFLTVVSVDSRGDMTLLIPNQWHPEFKLKAGQTVTIPSREMGFEMFATEPHGPTLLKAIATKRPLKLNSFSERGRETVSRASMEKTPLVPLGNIKGIGVRQRQQNEPVASTDTPTPTGNQVQTVQLTDQNLESTFQPNEWATASWNLATRPN